MDQQSGHLSDAQVEQYGNTVGLAQPETGDRDQVETHLADCPACRNRVLASQRARLGLLTDLTVNSTPHADQPGPGPDCPGEDDLRDLAAGLCPPNAAAKLIQHAAQCDHCGTLLRMYTEDFSDDLSAEDQAVLGKLKSSSEKWQKRLAGRMFLSERNASRSFLPRTWPKPALVGTTLALIVVAGGIALTIAKFRRVDELQHAQQLVAAAYGERRTTEMRLAGVPYAEYNPIPTERAGQAENDSTFERPSLLEAEHAVAKRQRSGALDPNWLQIKGRVELLEASPGSVTRALREFEKASSMGGDDARAKIDLAVADFERERSADKPDLRRTLDLLVSVVKSQKPGGEERSVALFDLAVAYEKLQAWDLAASTWEEYLAGDEKGPWADEARRRLKSIRDRIGMAQPETPDHAPSPESLLNLDPRAIGPTETERYQEVAMRAWLVPALAEPAGETGKAAKVLAALVEASHSDSWLSDFLHTNSERDLAATRALQSAIDANARGHHEEALRQSKKAQGIFARHRNLPGRLRAQFEQVYALQRLLRASECSDRAKLLLGEVAGTQYRWIQAQLFLESAICDNLSGRLASVDADLSASLKRAQDSHFSTLELRVLGIAAGIKRQQGKYAEAWQYAIGGLNRYWQGTNTPERLYQFYTSMELCAQETGFLPAAEALGRHSIAISEKEDNKVRLGAAHLLLADLLMGQGEVDASEVEARRADQLLQTAPDESSVNTYRLMSKIRLARLELRRGETRSALAALEPARSLVGLVEDRLVRLDFHTIDGTIQARLGHVDEGQEAYLRAIAVAEESLRSLKDEGSRLKWIKATDQAYRGPVHILLERHQDWAALDQWEWYKSRSLDYRPSRYAQSQSNSKKKASRLFPNLMSHSAKETRLIYAVFEDGVQIWALGDNFSFSVWTALPEDELKRLTEEFTRNCATPNSRLRDLQTQGLRLFGLLLQPVISRLPASLPLAVEVDGPLTSLPIEALRSPEGWYLGEKYALIYSPGILYERRLRQPKPIVPDERLLIVDSGSLPGHTVEEDSIRNFFSHATLVDSEAYTWRQILPLLPAADVFHFIGHGEGAGTRAALLLTSERRGLTGTDLPPRTLRRMNLAVLAACSTGATDENGLLDTESLVHSFMAGGVPELITSRWNVDSAVTGELMRELYTHFHAGASAPEAMRLSRQRILKSTEHPYYWASFSVAGRI